MKVLRAYRLLLRNGPLSRLLVGEFVSSIGDWLSLVAILILVYQVTEDPFILGLVGAARVLPYVLLSVPAGVVADRFDRRLVLLTTDVARGLLMLTIAAVVAVGGPLWLVVALAIGATCFAPFFGPAIGAYLPSLISEEDQLGPANSAWSTLDNLAFVIGPAVSGILIAAGGLVLAFLLNAVSFAVIAAVMWRLPSNRAAAAAVEPAAAEGAAARPTPASRDRAILVPLAGLAIIDIVGALAGGGLSVLTVVLATELGGGEAATGFLNAGIGLGGFVGAIVVGVLVLRPSLVPVLVGGSLVYGAGLAALGLAPALGLAIAAIAIASGGSLLIEVSSTTIFQRVIPDAVRGRALGLLGTISMLALSAGSFVLPVLADAIGVAAVLALIGAAIALAGIVGALMAAPAARRRAGSTADIRVTRLAELPLFAGVPAATLEAVASRLVPITVGAGETVIRQGEPADRFFLIEEGTFEVTRWLPAEPAVPGATVRAAAEAAAVPGAAATAAAAPAELATPEAAPEATAVEHLRTMGPGEVFGEIGLLRGVPRTATVTAATEGRLLALDGADFLQLVNAGPQVGPRLMDLRRGAPGAGY